MSPKSRILLTGATIGLVIAFIFGLTVGSIIWFRDNPSVSELNTAVDKNMNLPEDASAQVSQMVAVGAIIDFIISVMLYILPITCLGTFMGMFAAYWWYKSGVERT
jgi:hypothetical protein